MGATITRHVEVRGLRARYANDSIIDDSMGGGTGCPLKD
jgi:hypothetical protein